MPIVLGIILEECQHNLEPVIKQLQSGELAPRDKVRESCLIIYQVLCGVRDLHHFGVTHRDIKPGNNCSRAVNKLSMDKKMPAVAMM